MKNHLHFTFAIVILFSISTFAQTVPNGGFEEWQTNSLGGHEPTNWYAQSNTFEVSNVLRTDGNSGNYSAELKATDIPGLGVVAPILMSNDFPVSEKYAQLDIFVKGTPLNGDTLFIVSGMFKGSGIMVGVAYGYVVDQIDDFTKLEIVYDYFSTENPETCQVSFMVGKSVGIANLGSTFTIDDVSLVGVAGLNDFGSSFTSIGNLYPNPSNDFVKLPFDLKEPSELTLKVYGMQGRLVYSLIESSYLQGSNEISIDLNGLRAGPYFCTLSTGKNSVATKTFVVK